uniref:Uncharacterized protein n=1 Tax=Arundo donax TaxID=35708 RepID=A0A0A8ZPD2_ARUDO
MTAIIFDWGCLAMKTMFLYLCMPYISYT